MVDFPKPGLSGRVTVFRIREGPSFPWCSYGRGKNPDAPPCMKPSVVRCVLPAWHPYWQPQAEVDVCLEHAHVVTQQEKDARAEAAAAGRRPPRGRVRWGWWTTLIGGWAVTEIDALRSRGYPGHVVSGHAVIMNDQEHLGRLYRKVVYQPGSIALHEDPQ